MARRQIPTVVDDEIIDVTPEDVEGLRAEDVSKIVGDNNALENDIRAEMGDSDHDIAFKITVHRIPDTGKDLIFLFDLPGENVTGIRARLMREYGAGHYSIRVYKVEPGKGARLHRRFSTRIETPMTQAPAPQIGSASENALAQLVKQQGDALQMLMQRLTQAPAPAASDPLSMFQQMAGMAKAMRDMMGPPPVAAAPVDPFSMLNSVVSLVKDINSDGREKSTLEQVMEFANSDAVKMVVSNLQTQQQQPMLVAPSQFPQQPRSIAQPQTMQQPQSTPSVSHARPAAPSQNVATPDTDTQNEMLMDIRFLCTRADKGSDPITYAEYIYDKFDGSFIAMLLNQPDPVGTIGLYVPDVLSRRAWFDNVIAEMLSMRDDAIAQAQAEGGISAGAGLTPSGVAVQMAGAHDLDPVTPVANQRDPSKVAAVSLDGDS